MYKTLAKKIQFVVVMVLLFIPSSAFASLPQESPLEQLNSSLTGPVAKAVCTMVVCCSGVFLAVGESGPAGRLVGRLVFGLALAFGFAQIISMF